MNEQTFFCIRPQFFARRKAIKKIIEDSGLPIIQTKVVWLIESDVKILYEDEKPSSYFDASVEFMTCGFSEVGVIEGIGVISKLSKLTGDAHIPMDCKIRTLRRIFGKKLPVRFRGFDYYLNPIHRSRNKLEVERDLTLFQQLANRSLTTTLSDMIQKMHQDKNLLCVFDHHIKNVVALGKDLCEKFGGDKEIVELACWLHDIASLKTGSKHEHHTKGAKEAGRILRLLGQRSDLIVRVQECIHSHRGSVAVQHISKEAEIVCAADGIANLSYPSLLFFFAFGVKGLGFVEGIESIRRKVQSSFEKIPDFAKVEAVQYLEWWKRFEKI